MSREPKCMGRHDRDEIAKSVLVALLEGGVKFTTNGVSVETPKQYAVIAYAFADAMIATSKEPPNT